MKQSTLIIIAAAIVALAAGFGVKQLSSPTSVANQSSQVPLPEFSLPDLSGQQHNINEWQGKILVINFWATWCPPCIKEIPEFIALQQAYADKNVVFIGIAIDDHDAVSKFITNKPINYPILLANEDGVALSRKLGNLAEALPFTIVVDQQSHIVSQHPGEFSKQQLQGIIDTLVK